MLNNHYIPKLILRGFGDNIDIYDAERGRLEKGLVGYQGFFIKGLYDDDVEALFDTEIERFFRDWVEILRKGGDQESVEKADGKLRLYLALSYIRTPYFGSKYPKKEWNSIMRRMITGELTLDRFVSEASNYRLRLLTVIRDGRITFVNSDFRAAPFMISDRGVTFIDGSNAVYPTSKHRAIWISTDARVKKDSLTADEVLSVNDIIMADTYRKLGMSSIDEMLKSILHYSKKRPDDQRISRLASIAESLYNPYAETYNQAIRENSGIKGLCIPNGILEFIEKGVNARMVYALVAERLYYKVASIEVLFRFGMIDDSYSAVRLLDDSLTTPELKRCIEKYVDNARSEFDKCAGVIFLELMSERGDGHSSDRLRRYYAAGKHVIKDRKKSDYYLLRGCEQEYNDCLTAYFKTLMDDPDYEEKVSKINIRNVKGGSSLLMLAMVYREHGNTEEYLSVLERGVDKGYGPAVTEWAKYWINKEPAEPDMVRQVAYLTLGHQMDASMNVADFYRQHEDICPGQFEWYLERLKESGSAYYSKICLRYGLDIDDN